MMRSQFIRDERNMNLMHSPNPLHLFPKEALTREGKQPGPSGVRGPRAETLVQNKRIVVIVSNITFIVIFLVASFPEQHLDCVS